MVERLIVNQDVAGSSPAVAAKAFPIYFNIKKDWERQGDGQPQSPLLELLPFRG